MRLSTLATTLAFGTAFAAAPAHAQYGAPPPPPPQTATQTDQPQQEAKGPKPSRGAQKAIIELQTAVNANDTANIPGKLAAAQAVAKSAEDRFIIGALQLKAANAAKDNAGIAAGIEAVLASGQAPADQQPGLYAGLANAYIATNQADRAATAIEKLLTVEPYNAEATILLANTRKKQGQGPAAVAMLQKSIAATASSGRKADERLYRHAVQLAYDARLPVATQIARDWVQAYPTSENWRNALRIYRNMAQLDEAGTVDVFRLARATGSLSGDADFHGYAYTVMMKGYPGEAKTVLEEGIAAKKIDSSKPLFRDLMTEATKRAAGDRASLAASAKTALAAPTARQALTVADAYYGYGDYAQAAELYRAALSKSGADASLVNLHLGMALARAGDKVGATAALNAVTGPRAELAKYWLLYLGTRA